MHENNSPDSCSHYTFIRPARQTRWPAWTLTAESPYFFVIYPCAFHNSAPKQFIRYLEEDSRPQIAMDVDYENGMGISVGRIRKDTVYDWKFVGLSHNTVRGAAGGAILCAELLKAQGYITKK